MKATRLVLSATAVLAACSSSPTGSGNNGNNGGNNGGGSAAMSATLNTTAWSSAASYRATWTNKVISISGTSTDYTTISIAVADVQVAGTYSLTFGNPNGGLVQIVSGTKVWSSGYPGGSGTLMLTSLSSTHTKGTFSFVAIPAFTATSSADTIRVSDGKFDMDIQ